jgi:hypothetical protein
MIAMFSWKRIRRGICLNRTPNDQSMILDLNSSTDDIEVRESSGLPDPAKSLNMTPSLNEPHQEGPCFLSIKDNAVVRSPMNTPWEIGSLNAFLISSIDYI